MTSKIKKCSAHEILDSRDEWTIEVMVETSSGIKASASVPQGKSTGSREAVYVSTETAISNIETEISGILNKVSVHDQALIDKAMIDLDGTDNKSRLGANAILGVSIACAKAAALEKKIPLWKYLREIYLQKPVAGISSENLAIPRLYMNLTNGGLHAGNSLDFQEYLIIPNEKTIKENIELGTLFYKTLRSVLEEEYGKSAINVGDEGGFAPNFSDNLLPFVFFSKVSKQLGTNSINFGLDAAASNVKKESGVLMELYREMNKKFNLFYLEDPFGEDDVNNFSKITNELGGEMIIAGDDLTTTNPVRIREMAEKKAANGVIIKPNQIGSVSEALEAVRMARINNWKVIASHRSGETNDSFIADFAFAVGADGLKLGAPSRGERIAKYNRLLEIEQEAE